MNKGEGKNREKQKPDEMEKGIMFEISVSASGVTGYDVVVGDDSFPAFWRGQGLHIQGVTEGTDQTSGGCSLC